MSPLWTRDEIERKMHLFDTLRYTGLIMAAANLGAIIFARYTHGWYWVPIWTFLGFFCDSRYKVWKRRRYLWKAVHHSRNYSS